MDTGAIGRTPVTAFYNTVSNKAGEAGTEIPRQGDSFSMSSANQDQIIDPNIAGGAKASVIYDSIFAKPLTGIKEVFNIQVADPKYQIHLSPIIKDGFIYLNSQNDTIKMDMDGNIVWKKETGACDNLVPVFDKNNNMYIISDGAVKSLDENGNERWSNQVGRPGDFYYPVISDDGKVYVVGRDCNTFCFNNDGSTAWAKIVPGADPSFPPVLDKNGMLNVKCNGKKGIVDKSLIRRIDTTKKGEEASQVKGSTLLHKTAIDKEGNVYQVLDNKFTVTGSDGKIKWTAGLKGDIGSSKPVLGPDGNIYLDQAEHTIICFEPGGKEKWRLEGNRTNEPLSNKMAWDKNGVTYITGNGGNWKLYAINPDGSRKWTTQEKEHIANVKVGADGQIYTGGELYSLKIFNPDNGKLLWKHDAALGFGENYQITGEREALLASREGKLVKIHYTDKQEAIKNEIEKNTIEAEQKENLPDNTVTKTEEWVIIGGVKLPVNKNL